MGNPKRNGPWVLVVEDDMDIRLTVLELLQDHGIKCIGAMDGLEAIRVITRALHENHMPSIMFLDLNMPIFTGWEVLDLWEVTQPKVHDIPVVVTTAEATVELPKGVRSKVLKKPYTEDQIMAEINKAMKGDENVRRAGA